MSDRGGDANGPAADPGGVERTAATTVVAAPVDRVMAVLRDVGAYPSWTRAVREAETCSTDPAGLPERVRFVLDAGGVTDEYVLRYSWSADGRSVAWVLESSTLQRSQTGSYRLTPVEGGTEVAYELEIELAVPTIGRVRTRAERRIVGVALSELRRRAEATG